MPGKTANRTVTEMEEGEIIRFIAPEIIGFVKDLVHEYTESAFALDVKSANEQMTKLPKDLADTIGSALSRASADLISVYSDGRIQTEFDKRDHIMTENAGDTARMLEEKVENSKDMELQLEGKTREGVMSNLKHLSRILYGMKLKAYYEQVRKGEFDADVIKSTIQSAMGAGMNAQTLEPFIREMVDAKQSDMVLNIKALLEKMGFVKPISFTDDATRDEKMQLHADAYKNAIKDSLETRY